MKVGKISENILKRSVLKQIHTKRDEVLFGASVGEDCAAMKLKPDEVFVISTDPITGTAVDIGNLAVHITVNDLASSGAEPVGILLTVLLPEDTEEAALKVLMRQIEDVCGKLNIQIMGGHTEVTGSVNQPVVTVCGVGKAKEDQLLSANGVKPGQEIIVTKWIGLEGTSIIAKEKEKELLTKYPKHFIESAKNLDRYLSVLPEARAAVLSGVSGMHDVTEGGIFGALWEMAEASQVGMSIDLKKIPVKQETIEISEFFGINPYELISSGSMLMAADNGNAVVHAIEKAGVEAVVIGKTVAGRDRILHNAGEIRFLEPPKADELYKVIVHS